MVHLRLTRCSLSFSPRSREEAALRILCRVRTRRMALLSKRCGGSYTGMPDIDPFGLLHTHTHTHTTLMRSGCVYFSLSPR